MCIYTQTYAVHMPTYPWMHRHMHTQYTVIFMVWAQPSMFPGPGTNLKIRGIHQLKKTTANKQKTLGAFLVHNNIQFKILDTYHMIKSC